MESDTITDAVEADSKTTTGNESGTKPKPWKDHPIDIRISLPFLGTRFYCTIVAGQERRPGERRKQERQSYPLLTFGNALFTMGLTTMFMFVALVVFVAQSSIIE